MFRSFWGLVDRHLGRGSYLWMRPLLAPYQEDTHLAYAETLSRLVRPDIRWLDAGCGHKILARNHEKQEREIVKRTRFAVGCDTVVESNHQHRSLEKIIPCELSSLPFSDDSFDLVTLNMVAEHLVEPSRVFSELARVLDRDGQLVIHTPCASSYEIWLIRLGWKLLAKNLGFWMIRLTKGREPGNVFPTFYRANTRRILSKLMCEAGLVEGELRVIEGRPFFYFAAPLSILEIAVEWLLRAMGKNEVCPATLLGVYRRSRKCSHSAGADSHAAERIVPRILE
jgi:SAM-dependent methyltransferase